MIRPSIRRSFCSNSQIWMRAFCTTKSNLVNFKPTTRRQSKKRRKKTPKFPNSLTLWRNRKMRFCRHRRRPPKSQGEKHQKKRLANILGKIQLKQSMASETKGGRRRGEKERSVRWAGSWYAGPWWTPWLLRRRMLPPRASRSFWKEERGANPRLRGRDGGGGRRTRGVFVSRYAALEAKRKAVGLCLEIRARIDAAVSGWAVLMASNGHRRALMGRDR